jgi:hypothetical protein
MGISDFDPDAHRRRPWNAGTMVGPKRPLKPGDVWQCASFSTNIDDFEIGRFSN